MRRALLLGAVAALGCGDIPVGGASATASFGASFPFDAATLDHATFYPTRFGNPDAGQFAYQEYNPDYWMQWSDEAFTYGEGVVLLTAGALSCDAEIDFAQLSSPALEDNAGLLLAMAWFSTDGTTLDWPGTYLLGGFALSEEGAVARLAAADGWADAQAWTLPELAGPLEIAGADDAEVSGSLHTSTLDASFRATNCSDELADSGGAP